MNRKKLQLTNGLLQVLLTILLLPALNIHAQMGKLFDANHQLSSNFTNQVYLDNDGFIWSASRNGLNRYDGYQFHIYKKDNRTGMASNYVNCIIQDQKGHFYLGMWGTLQIYDGKSFQTIEVKDLNGNRIDCYVTCFLVRKNGEVWAGTSGFGVLKIDDTRHAHQVGGAVKGIHTAEQLMEDQKGNIWVLTRDNGLICFNEKTSHTYFEDSPMKASLRKICEGSDGTVYLGTSNAGLFKLAGNEFQKIATTEKVSAFMIHKAEHSPIILSIVLRYISPKARSSPSQKTQTATTGSDSFKRASSCSQVFLPASIIWDIK